MPAALLTHSSRLSPLLRPCSEYPTSTRVAKRQPFTSCLAAHLQFPPPSPQPLHCYTCSFSCTMLHMPRTCSTRLAMIFFIFIYFVPFPFFVVPCHLSCRRRSRCSNLHTSEIAVISVFFYNSRAAAAASITNGQQQQRQQQPQGPFSQLHS